MTPQQHEELLDLRMRLACLRLYKTKQSVREASEICKRIGILKLNINEPK